MADTALNDADLKHPPAESPLSDADRAQTDDPDYATEEYSEEYFRWIVDNKNYRSFKLRMRWIDRLVEPRSGDKIIDLGCGAGMVAEHCAEAGATVHGVDLSPVAIKVAREVNQPYPQASFEVGDASNVPSQQAGTFDKAISADVTEHCGYDVMMGIFHEAHRLLKPGGTYFIYTPNPHHWIELGKEYGPQVGPFKQHPAHTGLRTGPVICDALEKAGFEIVKNPKGPSMIPGVNALEWLWTKLPGVGTLANYRVIVLARKPSEPQA
ncbi:MAG: class I SAM-dependent methyltransferase [Planctomycetota bacterium]